MKVIFIVIGLILMSFSTMAQNVVLPSQTIFKLNKLWKGATAIPSGAEVIILEGQLSKSTQYTAIVKFPANYIISPNWNPNISHFVVLKGVYNLGFGDRFDKKKTTALKAGDVAIIKPQTRHFSWTNQETVILIYGTGPWNITYSDLENDPRPNRKK